MAKIVISSIFVNEDPSRPTRRKLNKRQAQVIKFAIEDIFKSDEFVDLTIENGFEVLEYRISIFGE